MFAIKKRAFSTKKFLCLLGIMVLFTLHSALAMQMAFDAANSLISGNYPVWPFADVCQDPSLITNPFAKALLKLIVGLMSGIGLFLFGIMFMKMVDDAEF